MKAGAGGEASPGGESGPAASPAYRWAIWAAGAALFALGAWLRLRGLGEQPLLGDDYHAMRVAAAKTWAEIFVHYEHADNSIPYTLWVEGVFATVGAKEWAVRLPAVVFGLALLGTPWMFRRQLTPAGCVLALGLLATSSICAYQTVVARPYSAAGFTGAALVAVWRSWYGCPTRGRALLLAVVASLGVWFHLFVAPMVVGLFFASCVRPDAAVDRKAHLRAVAVASVAIGGGLALLFGPGLGNLLAARADHAGAGQVPPAFLFSVARALAGFDLWLVLPTLLFGLVGLLAMFARDRALARALSWSFALVVAALWFAQPLAEEVAWARYAFGAWPLFMIVAAHGLERTVSWGAARLRVSSTLAPRPAIAALVVASAVPCLVAYAHPSRFFRRHPDGFRAARGAQIRERTNRVALPPAYAWLAEHSGPRGFLEHPYAQAWVDFGPYARMQRGHGKPVRMAAGMPFLVPSWLAELENIIDLRDADAVRRSGASHVLVHRNLTFEMARRPPPERLRQRFSAEAAWADEHLGARYGEPVFENGLHAVYALGP